MENIQTAIITLTATDVDFVGCGGDQPMYVAMKKSAQAKILGPCFRHRRARMCSTNRKIVAMETSITHTAKNDSQVEAKDGLMGPPRRVRKQSDNGGIMA
ncbi:hypothetical protein MTO96_050480 [Rhipicephalus appendiculatus]